VKDRIIRTSREHPFYVVDRGWVSAALLDPGDMLISDTGEWIPVERIVDTREVTTVYNLEVEDYHTYFVGCQEWGFSVWAHNADCHVIGFLQREGYSGAIIDDVLAAKGDPAKIRAALEKHINVNQFKMQRLVDGVAEQAKIPNVRGKITVEQNARDFASLDPGERDKLTRLNKTADALADGGHDVRVLGENPTQPGDIAFTPPGGKEIVAQNKRLNAGTKNSVNNNLRDGANQIADGGHILIDGSGVNLTRDTFDQGLAVYRSNLRHRTPKQGTVTVILGDGTIFQVPLPTN
jgi:hypothetical protein